MEIKKVLCAGLFIVASFTHFSFAMEEPPLTISPASGEYLYSQQFDIAINISSLVNLPYTLSPPYYDPSGPSAMIQINASVNGNDATVWFSECLQEHRSIETNTRMLLCKVLDHTPFEVGTNNLRVDIYDGMQIYSAEATYELIPSQRTPTMLPYDFSVQGKSVNTSTGIQVSQGQSVMISASGYVNLWPSNSSFPISSPRGTQVCHDNSTCILPGVPVGALLVKIGTYGRWMYAGTNLRLVADRPGELIFAVNDRSELVPTSDNTGSYQVTVF